MISLLEEPLLWRLCFFYTVSFGGFLGLSHSMPSFLRDQYSVDPLACGHLTALIALIGTLFRPIGGFLADKIGGPPLLAPLLAAIGLSYILVGQLPGLELMIGLLTLMTIFLGMGSGVVFQLLTHRFPSHIGAATGIVGALGGLGGFFLPIFLGSAKQVSGSFGAGFLALGLVAAAAAISARNLVAEGGKL
jgi:NNP family nitrate/nitrite transporter-like MFS transporter